jgi:cytochrome b subunit of formate dehydrogenase
METPKAQHHRFNLSFGVWIRWITALATLSTPSMAQDDATCQECHAEASAVTVGETELISPLVDSEVISNSVHDLWECIDCHEGYDPEAIPHVDPPHPVDCVGCHEDFDPSTHAFHPQIAKLISDPLALSLDPAANCTGCHGGHAIVEIASEEFAFAGEAQIESCGACHEVARDAYLSSAHFLVEGDTPDCLACHRTDLVDGDRPAAVLKLAQSALCMTCHVDRPEAESWTHLSDRFVASWGSSIHGLALEAGNAEAASCVDCHGSHDMKRAMVADSRVNKLHIPETCAKCHEEEAAHYEQGVHADALHMGVIDSPVCTDCHGEHLILDHEDPNALVAPRNLSEQLCGECHGSVRLSRKYGISSDRFETFSDSYHGLAIRGGAVEVVNCASCHGAHAIYPSSDPRSPVHKANLVQTCGECHPGANELFAVGTVHVALTPIALRDLRQVDQESLPQIVATVYVWLIVAIVGSMCVHNLLDFFKKTRKKVHGQRSGHVAEAVPHRLYLRMTLHERLQHGVLVISFVVLVVTGFMLSYPEAWWVQGVRRLNSHFFELRSWTHRIAGVVLMVSGLWHFAYCAGTVRGRALISDLRPRLSDLRDMVGVLRYNLGLSSTKPPFGRFSYIEKLEYWAMMWGSVLMGITGLMLWGEAQTMGILTKIGFDIAHTVHFYEAILATLSIFVWHFYFVIFNPDIYPMNLSWLTGYLSAEEMESEHPAELERIQKAEASAPEVLDDR